MLDISRSVACSSRTTVTGPWRENPLQRLDLERSNSTCRLPYLTVNRLYNWPPCCHRVVRRAGFHPKDFSNAWASGAQVPALPSSSRTWALQPPWQEVCVEIFMIRELSPNASWIERNYSHVPFFRANRMLPISRFLKGLRYFPFLVLFLFEFYRAICN